MSADKRLIAACGLYCGSCGKLKKGKCPGCGENEKASWCAIRACCKENNYANCAECTIMPLESCKKFNNFIGKVISMITGSDRPACIMNIRETGAEAYATRMHTAGLHAIKKNGR